MELVITEKAAQELKKAMGEGPQTAAGLRLGVMAGGCCGARYSLALADTAGQDETVAESQGIKVFVDPGAADQVTGAVIDFVTTPTGAGFHISRPTEAAAESHEHGHGHGHGHGGGGCACGSGGGGCGCGSGGGHGGHGGCAC